ncbi:MAG: hypothetical protein OQL07_11220 [Gammaproteobacteria bacterium]|nr:hypothetical protein [Gammaproteobacteria bacterium]
MGNKKDFLLLVAGLVFAVGVVSGAESDGVSLHRADAQLRLNYEVLDVGAGESLGLAGVHYLVDVAPGWYFGPSGFGALYGERGGFFTGGFTAGTRRQVADNWFWDAGLFVGGGGGGAAPQGSGLMLRPHLGLGYDLGGWRLEGAVSHVRFPDGDIDSTQLSLGLARPFGVYYGDAQDVGRRVAPAGLRGLSWRNSEWLATWADYRPDDGVTTTGGGAMASLQRVGFEYRRYGDGGGYLFAETAGALGGDSDGFAELLAGAGYRLGLSERLSALGALSAGGAGGGQVDTEGGLVGKARLGLEYLLLPDLKLGLEAGRMESAGSFAADFYGVNLGYRLGGLAEGRPGLAWNEGDIYLARWRLLATQHTYLDAARKDGTEQNLGLVGLKIERFFSRHAYLSGQAYGGWEGDAGGYAVGLIGAGAEWSPPGDGRLGINLELAAGAAGGGGVDVGGGAIVQPTVGVSWRAGRNIGLRLEAGRVVAVDGELDSNLLGLGLVYEFSRP